MDEHKKRLVETRLFFESHDVLEKSFPLKFETHTINKYNCFCAECGEKTNSEYVRGSANQILKNVFEINAVAVCQRCNTYNTHDNVRLREDEGVLCKQFYIEGNGWVKQYFDEKPKGFIEKILGL